MKVNLERKIPPGVRDILPEEAGRKRQIENQLGQAFGSWGYREVLTPTFEYYDALVMGGLDQEDNLYKFLDRQGKLLALRPDMTTPIARMVATRLKDCGFPQRLCYFSNAFSYADPQMGRQREFFQAGVELIGLPPGEADGEVIALAVEALKGVGLRKFRIHVGQIDVFNGLMEELGLAEEDQVRVKQAISAKNYVGLEELLLGLGCTLEQKETVVRITSICGGQGELAQALQLTSNPRAVAAIKNLHEIFVTLEMYGVTEYVMVDLGVLRGFDYYTGMVFEGYSSELGFPICGGGRYDGLLAKFGFECPATGFALGIDRIYLALNKHQQVPLESPLDYIIVYQRANLGQAITKATELRQQGLRVELIPKTEDIDVQAVITEKAPLQVIEVK